MIQKIGTAVVYVDDQAAAVDFWTKRVGFEVRRSLPMTPQASWIEVAPPGAESCIVIYPKSLMATWREMKPSNCLHVRRRAKDPPVSLAERREVHEAAAGAAMGLVRSIRRPGWE